MHESSEHSQALLGAVCTMFILLISLGFVSRVLYLLVLIGLNWWLWLDHLVLVLPGGVFWGFSVVLVGWKIGVLYHCSMLSSVCNCHLERPVSFISKKGRGSHSCSTVRKQWMLLCDLCNKCTSPLPSLQLVLHLLCPSVNM